MKHVLFVLLFVGGSIGAIYLLFLTSEALLK